VPPMMQMSGPFFTSPVSSYWSSAGKAVSTRRFLVVEGAVEEHLRQHLPCLFSGTWVLRAGPHYKPLTSSSPSLATLLSMPRVVGGYLGQQVAAAFQQPQSRRRCRRKLSAGKRPLNSVLNAWLVRAAFISLRLLYPILRGLLRPGTPGRCSGRGFEALQSAASRGGFESCGWPHLREARRGRRL
jgi:hypothetical protein